MLICRELNPRRHFLGRIEKGRDLLEELTALAERYEVRLGLVQALGAVSRARLAYYRQAEQRYEYFELERPLEIAGLNGNVSLKEGRPFVHAHLTLTDEEWRAFGGHLAPGTLVFACEFHLLVLEGADLCREPDSATGLMLWSK